MITRRMLLVCSRCGTAQNRRVAEDAVWECPACGSVELEVRKSEEV